ncbi:MAG: hypothetical protein PHC58_05290, partial [Candidatus Omnitrophica bacterium]|nr:hypothetical protein [Candidatus Omnitrophota bacterium]
SRLASATGLIRLKVFCVAVNNTKTLSLIENPAGVALFLRAIFDRESERFIPSCQRDGTNSTKGFLCCC